VGGDGRRQNRDDFTFGLLSRYITVFLTRI
jgi:hypothetical protein